MSDYISRDVLTDAVYISMHDNPHKDGVRRACHNTEHMHFAHMIYHTPAADVKPVVHAKWIFKNDRCGCSNCRNCLSYDGNGVVLDLSHLPYCPHCGATMDGE